MVWQERQAVDMSMNLKRSARQVVRRLVKWHNRPPLPFFPLIRV